jgi:hypothetical protein
MLIQYRLKYVMVFPGFGGFYMFNMLLSRGLFRAVLPYALALERRLRSKQLRVHSRFLAETSLAIEIAASYCINSLHLKGS